MATTATTPRSLNRSNTTRPEVSRHRVVWPTSGSWPDTPPIASPPTGNTGKRKFSSLRKTSSLSTCSGSALRCTTRTKTFSNEMRLVDGDRPVDLLWAPSEVNDALAIWLPEQGILHGGAATPVDTIPNIGTPLRTQRFTVGWADTLHRLATLGADVLITEFGPVIKAADAVHERLSMTAEALLWLRAEVVRRMNLGMDEREILADMDYPPALFDHAWMLPTYGAPDYIVRDIYREENGWWDRNPTALHPTALHPTTLHPAPPNAAAAVILSAITDRQHVLDLVRTLAEDGQTQLALHVVDLLALAPGNDSEVEQARALKVELCRTRAREVDPYVSKACYASSARLLDAGHKSWTYLQ